MSVLESTEAAPAAQAPPEPFLTGSFSAYRHRGGIVVAWRKKGEEAVRKLQIPSFILQAAAAQAGCTVDEVLEQLLGMAAE